MQDQSNTLRASVAQTMSGYSTVDEVEHRILLTDIAGRNRRTLQALPRRFRDATADNPDVARWADTYAAAVGDDLRQRLNTRPHCPGLFIYGPVGIGKTWQAVGLINTLAERDFPVNGFEVVRAVDFIEGQVSAPFDEKRRLFAEAVDARVLVLDDLCAGGEHRKSAASDLFRLLDARFADERPTIITSNVSGQQLAAEIGERLVDRLRESTIGVRMQGQSRRVRPEVAA